KVMVSKSLSVRAKNFGTPATLLCVSLILAGCQGENDVTASGASQNATAAPASQFTSESTPTEIAMAALAAIRNNDSEALLGLIAIDKVQSDLKAITGGKKSFQGMVDNAARSAVSAIRSEITF